MASQRQFDQVPPFPEDLPIANIPTVSLQDLVRHTESGVQQLFDAAQSTGLFLLDLRGNGLGESMLFKVDALDAAMRTTMDLADQVKKEFASDAPKSLLGFKERGKARTETGQPDRFEWFNLSLDGLSGLDEAQPLPGAIEPFRKLFASYAEHGRTIAALLYETLAVKLGLPRDTFASLAPADKASGSILRFIKAFASLDSNDMRTSMHHHTDFGTITLLVNVLGGLQVLRPNGEPKDSSSWMWVKPKPGCLIVNIGDAMTQWTGGAVQSPIHRIFYAPGQQRLIDRYSIGLFFRPERNASMRQVLTTSTSTLDDHDCLSAHEWEIQKTMALIRSDASSK